MNSKWSNSKRHTEVRRSYTRSVRRPQWVDSQNRQLAVIVGDNSPSMSGKKATDAGAAIVAFNAELAQPCNKGAFDVALITFHGLARRVMDLTPAVDALSVLQRSPLLVGEGIGTNITAALEEAENVMDDALARPVYGPRPVLLLFSDGGHNSGPEEPDGVADRIKQKADLVTVAYEDGDEDLLRRLASTPQHFYKCRDGTDLRDFMVEVGETLTSTLARGISATGDLGTLNRG